MDLSKLGIIGYKGRLGSELVRSGCTPIDTDITITGSIVNSLRDTNFDVIINCAAFSNVDGCENNPLRAYRINSFAPQNLSDCFKGKIVHLSSDYIFDGQSGPYTESDQPNPQCTYGFSKYMAEIGFRTNKNVLIVRTTILYDNKTDNFVNKIYKKLKQKESVPLPNLYGNPTYIPHLVKGILYSVEKDLTGVINISGKDYSSRYELGRKIADKFGFDKNLITRGIAWGEAKRGVFMGFVLNRAQALEIPLFTLDEGLEEFKNNVS